MKSQISVTIDTTLLKKISLRSKNRSEGISNDLQNYYVTLSATRNTLRKIITHQEMLMLCDMIFTLGIGKTSIVVFPILVGERKAEFLSKWNLDPESPIVDKLKAMTPFEILTIIDAAECWIKSKRSQSEHPFNYVDTMEERR